MILFALLVVSPTHLTFLFHSLLLPTPSLPSLLLYYLPMMSAVLLTHRGLCLLMMTTCGSCWRRSSVVCSTCHTLSRQTARVSCVA